MKKSKKTLTNSRIFFLIFSPYLARSRITIIKVNKI